MRTNDIIELINFTLKLFDVSYQSFQNKVRIFMTTAFHSDKNLSLEI